MDWGTELSGVGRGVVTRGTTDPVLAGVFRTPVRRSELRVGTEVGTLEAERHKQRSRHFTFSVKDGPSHPPYLFNCLHFVHLVVFTNSNTTNNNNERSATSNLPHQIGPPA